MAVTVAAAPTRSTRPPGIVLAAILFTISAVVSVLNKLVFAPSPFTDLKVYQLEGNAVRHGLDLYGHLHGVSLLATYPPFAGLVFTAMTPMSFAVLKVLNVLLSLASMAWIGVASARLSGCERDRALTLGLTAAAIGLWCEPTLMTLQYGQVNLYLLALVLWDFTRRPGSRLTGIGVGLAAAIKVTPAIFVVYLLLTRRFAMAARAVATFVGAFLVSLAVDAHATVAYWTDHVLDTSRVGRLENAVNQTIRGWLVRANHSREIPSAEMLLVVAAACFGLYVAVHAYREFGDRWGVPAAAVTGLICAPIAWSHHWVWCVPIFVLLWVERRFVVLAVGVAIFFSFSVWAIPHGDHDRPVELHLTWWQVLLSGWYVLFGVIFLVLALSLSRRARAAR